MELDAEVVDDRRSTGAALVIVVLMFVGSVALLVGILMSNALAAGRNDKPTIVLVHGAFAGSSSWNGVAARLLAAGYPVVAVANPLRGVKSDGQYVRDVVASIKGPVILVGHSYGGNVISAAAKGSDRVKGLVYVSGLAPEANETASTLVGRFPGSTLGPNLAPPVALADGGRDLYIQQDKYHAQFAADVPAGEASLMAMAQRPITEAALNEAADTTAWKTIPSWFFYGSLDRNIPAAVHAFMAKRAKAREVVEIEGGSHSVLVSHPAELTRLIEEAATDAPR